MSLAQKKFYENMVYRYVDIPRLRVVFRLLEGYRAKSILDVGCGDGSICKKIGEIVRASQLQGVEINQKAIGVARRAKTEATAVNLDEDDLPFDNYFDLVVALEILEHLFDPDHVVKEIKRVLRPNSLFIISIPNLAWWVNRLVLLLGYQPYFTEVSTTSNKIGKLSVRQPDPVGHLRVWTYRSFREFALFHGFHIVKIDGAAFSSGASWVILEKMDSLLSAMPSLSSFIVSLLRK